MESYIIGPHRLIYTNVAMIRVRVAGPENLEKALLLLSWRGKLTGSLASRVYVGILFCWFKSVFDL